MNYNNKFTYFNFSNQSLHDLVLKKFKIDNAPKHKNLQIDSSSNKNTTVILNNLKMNNNLVLLSLFLNKIYNYEPSLLLLIAEFHDSYYIYLFEHSNIEHNIIKYINPRKPIKSGNCMGDMYNNTPNNSNTSNNNICICTQCDPYGYYLLKDYRIYNDIKEILHLL
jgi:hypothetical protein